MLKACEVVCFQLFWSYGSFPHGVYKLDYKIQILGMEEIKTLQFVNIGEKEDPLAPLGYGVP